MHLRMLPLPFPCPAHTDVPPAKRQKTVASQLQPVMSQNVLSVGESYHVSCLVGVLTALLSHCEGTIRFVECCLSCQISIGQFVLLCTSPTYVYL